jgi:hypothetical protein
MMKATNRDRVLIADFAAQRARLGKAKMMRIGWFAAAHHARPLGHELEVVLIAQAKGLEAEQPPVAAIEEIGTGRPLSVGKTIRLRDKDHRKYVSKQPCVVCGRAPSDPHHLRFAQPRALDRKVSDEFTVPVCRLHHRKLHRHGDEAAWWNGVNIDPVPIAIALWQSTHRDGAFRGPPVQVATGEDISPSGSSPRLVDQSASGRDQHPSRSNLKQGPSTAPGACPIAGIN